MRALLISASVLFLAACSGGSGESAFVSNCEASVLEQDAMPAAKAAEVCDCTGKRLAATLDKSEMSVAADMIAMNMGEVQEYVTANPASQSVAENVQSTVKSCMQ